MQKPRNQGKAVQTGGTMKYNPNCTYYYFPSLSSSFFFLLVDTLKNKPGKIVKHNITYNIIVTTQHNKKT